MRCSIGLGFLFSFLFAGAIGRVLGEGEVASNCEELGFTGLALCSDCDSFADFVKDEELVADCRRCCAQEADSLISQMTFASAVLEMCGRKLPFYSNIARFVDESAKNFPLLKIKWRQGSPPKLVLRDENGVDQETVRIDSWKTEQIEEFLTTKLQSPSATKTKSTS
eukprot:TRINITY_DN7734_c0_g1_i1.p1 TRINITY_DN7734_c0_g1~~TRINITY_DN7734_c0_g1_i1.p1  ORF type:complete len:167 (+),score=26.09 TRINITY_DN7734_c0_g1_i1:140-640(+)